MHLHGAAVSPGGLERGNRRFGRCLGGDVLGQVTVVHRGRVARAHILQALPPTRLATSAPFSFPTSPPVFLQRGASTFDETMNTVLNICWSLKRKMLITSKGVSVADDRRGGSRFRISGSNSSGTGTWSKIHVFTTGVPKCETLSSTLHP